MADGAAAPSSVVDRTFNMMTDRRVTSGATGTAFLGWALRLQTMLRTYLLQVWLLAVR